MVHTWPSEWTTPEDNHHRLTVAKIEFDTISFHWSGGDGTGRQADINDRWQRLHSFESACNEWQWPAKSPSVHLNIIIITHFPSVETKLDTDPRLIRDKTSSTSITTIRMWSALINLYCDGQSHVRWMWDTKSEPPSLSQSTQKTFATQDKEPNLGHRPWNRHRRCRRLAKWMPNQNSNPCQIIWNSTDDNASFECVGLSASIWIDTDLFRVTIPRFVFVRWLSKED